MTACWTLPAAVLLVCSMLQAQAGEQGVLKSPFFAMDTCTQPRYPRSDIPPEAQLDLVKELGYRGMSWTLGDPAEGRAVAEAARKRGLRLYALYAGATLRRDRLEWDPRLKEALAALKGHDTILWLHVGSADYPPSSPEGDAVALAGLRELAGLAAANGLRVALYPHAGDWIERTADALRLVKAAGHRSLGLSFNLCHALRAGEETAIPALLAEAGPRLFAVTINGADRDAAGAGWDRLIQTLDRGSYDAAPLLRRLRKIGYAGPIGLQGYGVKGDMRENLARSMAAWRWLTKAAARDDGD